MINLLVHDFNAHGEGQKTGTYMAAQDKIYNF